MPVQSKAKKVEAVEACVVVVGARAPEFQKAIVRDRHSGRLAEVALTEYDPVDPGDEGQTFVFKKGEKVRADHPAVLAAPGAFSEIDDDD